MPAGRSPECIGTTVRRSPCQTFRWLPFPGSSRCSMPSLAARRRSRRRSSEARIQGESGTQGDARARKIGQICPTIRPAARRDRPRGRPRGRPLDGPGRPRRPRRRPVGMSPTPADTGYGWTGPGARLGQAGAGLPNRTCRTGAGYCAASGPVGRRVTPPAEDWATGMRSNGSSSIGGRKSRATAVSAGGSNRPQGLRISIEMGPRSPFSLTLFPHPSPSLSSLTLLPHSLPSPSSLTLFPHPSPSLSSLTLPTLWVGSLPLPGASRAGEGGE